MPIHKEIGKIMENTGKIEQMIRIASEHGHEARPNLTGGIDLRVEWTHISTGEQGHSWEPCHDIRSLKLALGY